MAKRRAFNPGIASWPRESMSRAAWCIRNGIRMCIIWAVKHEGLRRDFCIEIEIKGKTSYSPSYAKGEVVDKLEEFYKYYYDKYNTDENKIL